MRRVFAVASVSIVLAVGTALPSIAAEDDKFASLAAAPVKGEAAVSETTTTTTTTAAPAAVATPAVKRSGSSSDCVGARVTSILLGSVVGVPVSMVRRSKIEAGIATKELVGDSAPWWKLAIAAPLGVPAGMVSGLFQGFLYGPYNAWKYADQPFSAEAFSLTDGPGK